MNQFLGLVVALIAACSCCRAQDETGPQPEPADSASLPEITRGIEKLGKESDELAERMKTLSGDIASTSSALFGSKPGDAEKRQGLRDRYLDELQALSALDKGSPAWAKANAIAEATRKQVDDMQARIDHNTAEYASLRAKAATARAELVQLLDQLEALSKQPPSP